MDSKMTKTLVLAVLFSAGLQAQTTLTPDAIRPGTVIGVMVCIPPGTTNEGCKLAVLDLSIVLDMSVSPPRLRAVCTAAQWKTVNFAMATTQSGFTIPDAGFIPGSLGVYRNGQLQTVGVDYTLAGVALTFLPKSTPLAGDLVALKYAW
jgi:hypothetical protein